MTIEVKVRNLGFPKRVGSLFVQFATHCPEIVYDFFGDFNIVTALWYTLLNE
jgi:hypothetical protein